MNPYDFEADRKKQQEELARLMKENAAPGVAQPPSSGGGFHEAVRPKLEGLRKFNDKAYTLLSVVKFGFLGGTSVLLGLLFVWAGLASGFEWKVLGFGVLLVALGAWMLRIARQSWRYYREISKE